MSGFKSFTFDVRKNHLTLCPIGDHHIFLTRILFDVFFVSYINLHRQKSPQVYMACVCWSDGGRFTFLISADFFYYFTFIHKGRFNSNTFLILKLKDERKERGQNFPFNIHIWKAFYIVYVRKFIPFKKRSLFSGAFMLNLKNRETRLPF